MDYLWTILGAIFLLAGLIGCVLPCLPGPPLAYAGLLLLHLTTWVQFPLAKLIIGAILAVIVVALDSVVPVIGTKKFGGTKAGMWGSTIGAIVGFFIPLWGLGIIVGPFLGAVVGEWAFGNRPNAWKSGFGAFLGFLFGTLLKLVVCILFVWWSISAFISRPSAEQVASHSDNGYPLIISYYPHYFLSFGDPFYPVEEESPFSGESHPN